MMTFCGEGGFELKHFLFGACFMLWYVSIIFSLIKFQSDYPNQFIQELYKPLRGNGEFSYSDIMFDKLLHILSFF